MVVTGVSLNNGTSQVGEAKPSSSPVNTSQQQATINSQKQASATAKAPPQAPPKGLLGKILYRAARYQGTCVGAEILYANIVMAGLFTQAIQEVMRKLMKEEKKKIEEKNKIEKKEKILTEREENQEKEETPTLSTILHKNNINVDWHQKPSLWHENKWLSKSQGKQRSPLDS